MSSNTKRLLAILESGRKIKPNTEYIEGWRLTLKAADLYETHRKIGLLHALVRDAAAEAKQNFPEETGSIDHWESLLAKLLRETNPGAQWQTFFSRIDPHVFQYLRLQSKFIELQSPGCLVDEEQLENVRKLLQEALDETMRSGAKPEVIMTIARRIRLIIGSIEDFIITGNEAIFDEIKAAAVELEIYKKQDEPVPISEKFTTALGTLANAITVATGVPQLAAPATYLIAFLK